MIGKVMNWINYWFIEPLKPSFTKEITTRYFKKRKFPITIKWGFPIFGDDSLIPMGFKLAIPGMFMGYVAYILTFILEILIKLDLTPDFVLNSFHYGLKPAMFLAYPLGRRIGRNLYRAMVDQYCVKKLKWDD